MEDAATDTIRSKVRDSLIFLFRGDDVEKVKVLSGGERNRLAFVNYLQPLMFWYG
jgi:ATPase subunit of ABC transporter with duplicated ATPase domains